MKKQGTCISVMLVGLLISSCTQGESSTATSSDVASEDAAPHLGSSDTVDAAVADATDIQTSVDVPGDAETPDVPDWPPVHECAACLPDEYCDTYHSSNPDCGFESWDGDCRKRPTTCEGEPIAAVCACDNVVYPNACEANRVGVSIAPPGRHLGCAPQPSGAPCDPPSVRCVTTDYCQTPTGLQGAGTCAPRPTDCTGEPASPVCSVSGVAYPNACEAHKAGEQLQFDSISCQKLPCQTTADCPDATYCDLEPFCGAAGPGICRPRPTSCDGSTKYPSCGCDGKDYESTCAARLAGVTPKKDGLCAEGGPTCLGVTPDECGAGSLCQFPIANGACPTGEVPELAGDCVVMPTSCPEASADSAVCGCDGATWPSLCHAHAAGVPALRASPCD